MLNYTVPKDNKKVLVVALDDTNANFMPQPASKLTNNNQFCAAEANHYETDKEKAA